MLPRLTPALAPFQAVTSNAAKKMQMKLADDENSWRGRDFALIMLSVVSSRQLDWNWGTSTIIDIGFQNAVSQLQQSDLTTRCIQR